MEFKLFFHRNVIVIFTVALAVVGVLFQEKIESLFSNIVEIKSAKVVQVFSQEQLARFDGVVHNSLYLAVIGSVFDVTEGRKHYEKGATYNYFIGKDGSRAFITGNFNDETENKDHVLDLNCDELFSLLHWRKTFSKKYKPIGVLTGRYYDKNGIETVYFKELNIKINNCESEKEIAKKQDIKFPPCNSEWDVDKGTRVWCTKTSGGLSRSWIGVPRQLFTPGEDKPRCACINLDADNSGVLLKEYKNCPSTYTSCDVISS